MEKLYIYMINYIRSTMYIPANNKKYSPSFTKYNFKS